MTADTSVPSVFGPLQLGRTDALGGADRHGEVRSPERRGVHAGYPGPIASNAYLAGVQMTRLRSSGHVVDTESGTSASPRESPTGNALRRTTSEQGGIENCHGTANASIAVHGRPLGLCWKGPPQLLLALGSSRRLGRGRLEATRDRSPAVAARRMYSYAMGRSNCLSGGARTSVALR